jgi:hypothetical protein
MGESDNPDIGMLVLSMGAILAIIGFILFLFFVVVNPSVQPGTSPIQFQKVYASVGFIILGLILIFSGAFISKR